MRYSKLVLLSTLSAVALLTASTTSPAFGPSVTDIGLLRPHNVWQVGGIEAKNSSYCAMVSQFDKEITLAFARNPAGYGSLAIDFPGGILESGMMYEVTLQVDDLEARRYEVRAASARSIIVQIGQDEDFYSSLGSNGTLRISLPTVDMRFDLKKFSGSYISLVTCADKLPQHEGPRTAAMPVPPVEKTPLPGATTAPVTKTAAATAPETKTETKTAATKTPVPAVPAAPVKLATAATPPAAASIPQKDHDDLQMQAEAVRKSLNEKGIDTQANNTQTSLPPVVLTQPNDKTTAPAPGIIWTTAAAKKTPDAGPHAQKDTTVRLAEENGSALEENMELKSKLSQDEINLTELTNSVNLLKSEKYDLQSKLDMKAKQAQMLEAAMSAKDRDLSSVRSLSINDGKTLSDAQMELASVKRDRDAVVADLQSRLADKSQQYDTLQKQFTDSAVVRRTMEERSSQAQAEVETLREQLAQAQQQVSASDSQKSDLATQVEFQGQQNKTLLQRVQDQLSKATEQISLLESQLTSVAMQRDDLTSQLDAETNKNKALEANLDVKDRELAYRPTPSAMAAPAPVPSFASAPESDERSSMNLLGSERGYTPAAVPATTPPPLPTEFTPSAPVVKASASAPASGDNWDTVVVQ